MDHILPRAAWRGSTIPAADPDEPDNLAAACWECNVIGKHAQTHGIDPFSGLVVPLFHPRRDRWRDHFEWSSDYLRLKGKTPTGWATIRALDLNGATYRTQRRLLRRAMAAGGPALAMTRRTRPPAGLRTAQTKSQRVFRGLWPLTANGSEALRRLRGRRAHPLNRGRPSRLHAALIRPSPTAG